MTTAIARQSPWGGPLLVSDAHVHFFSRRFFETLASQKPGLTLEAMQEQLDWRLPPAAPEELAALWARDLDSHGVLCTGLMASVPGDEASVIAAERAYPDRFIPFAMVNPAANPKVENFTAALEGIRVACLFPSMHAYSMHDECVARVFEWASQEAASRTRAVFVHCGVLSVGVRGKLGLPAKFDLRYSNPIDLHDAALRYPTVPIIIPHFGAGYFREALMLADLCPNVYLDTSSSNQWMRYQESRLDLRQVFRRALDVVGPRRLLFGTDSSYFPRGWHYKIFEQQATALYELGLNMADAQAIFGENLLRILPRSSNVNM